jgi:ABC-2 type transport system ATP-binding protein
MLEVNNIWKNYGKKEILKGASFTAKRGECIGIIGMNGSGKSTLLSIISGILKSDKGSIKFYGEEAVRKPKVFSKYVGYVPQDHPLIEELSVYDNLKLWYSKSNRDLKRALETGIPKLLEINGFLKMPVRKLSGGMKKRVSLACALVHTPAVLVLDEPSVALDLVYKKQMHDFLHQYLEQGGIVIITSHDEMDLEICDRQYIMHEGILKETEFHLNGKELVQLFLQGKNQ